MVASQVISTKSHEPPSRLRAGGLRFKLFMLFCRFFVRAVFLPGLKGSESRAWV